MKRLMKSATVVVLMFSVLFADSTIAFAFTKATAGNLDEVVDIVREAGMRREDRIMIDYTGEESELDGIEYSIPDNYNYNFLYGMLLMRDDPNTSDDADYLVGNLDFGNGLLNLFYYKNRPQLIFNMDYFETAEQTKYVNEHVGEILKSIGVEGKSNYEKVKAIHDYICELITYDHTTKDPSSMYGAITNRRAVCNAYSLCMYKLCVEAGIPCKYIGGYIGNGHYGGHAWNIVALGDKWYYVDTTWDDEEEGICYDYFLKGTEDFDEVDPTVSHLLEDPLFEAPFKDVFPIARTKFVKGSPDENRLIKIAGTNPGDSDPKVTYEKAEIIKKTSPSDRKINTKKKKKTELKVFLKDKRAASIICCCECKIKKGKSIIRNPEALEAGLGVKKGQYYACLRFEGKKKGNVSIAIEMTLVNGQKMEVTFDGKIK